MTTAIEKKLIADVMKLLEKWDEGLDNDGQVVIYTGVYEHDDGEYYTYPQDDHDED